MIDSNTYLLIQGITGTQGKIHAQRTIESGMKLVGGTSPGKAGETVCDLPVYNTVADLKKEHPEVNATMILVPPKFVLAAAFEAIDNGIKIVVIITEFVPVLDAMKIVNYAKERGATVVGPNTIGVIKPGVGKIGVMPEYIYKKGHIGIISRSGTLTHEVSSNLAFAGYGESLCVCIGGDMVTGLSHSEALDFVLQDKDTKALILLGEIGGSSEEDAAEKISKMNLDIPVIAYIVGVSAPEGKKMGHAGAIASDGKGSAKSKVEALEKAGIKVAKTTGQLVDMIKEIDKGLNGILNTVEKIEDLQ